MNFYKKNKHIHKILKAINKVRIFIIIHNLIVKIANKMYKIK